MPKAAEAVIENGTEQGSRRLGRPPKWDFDTPQQTINSVEKFFEWLMKYPNRDGLSLYVYRVRPKIDHGLIGEDSKAIGIYSDPSEWNLLTILENHGGGKLWLQANDSNRVPKDRAKTYLTDWTTEPKLDLRTLLLHDPANMDYVQKQIKRGLLVRESSGEVRLRTADDEIATAAAIAAATANVPSSAPPAAPPASATSEPVSSAINKAVEQVVMTGLNTVLHPPAAPAPAAAPPSLAAQLKEWKEIRDIFAPPKSAPVVEAPPAPKSLVEQLKEYSDLSESLRALAGATNGGGDNGGGSLVREIFAQLPRLLPVVPQFIGAIRAGLQQHQPAAFHPGTAPPHMAMGPAVNFAPPPPPPPGSDPLMAGVVPPPPPAYALPNYAPPPPAGGSSGYVPVPFDMGPFIPLLPPEYAGLFTPAITQQMNGIVPFMASKYAQGVRGLNTAIMVAGLWGEGIFRVLYAIEAKGVASALSAYGSMIDPVFGSIIHSKGGDDALGAWVADFMELDAGAVLSGAADDDDEGGEQQ